MNNDLISREALLKAMWEAKGHYPAFSDVTLQSIYKVIDNAPTVKTYCYFCGQTEHGQIEERPQGEWIPIKTRPGTDEEYEEFSQYGDCPREDFRVFECPLPDDEQKVLVTTRWGDICTDTWHRDVDCCYFEDNCDDDDVVAWMPLPEPYKKGGAE